MNSNLDPDLIAKKKRILLVVDDEPQICRLMARCLKDLFDDVITVCDPLDAHMILEKQPVTHILSDLFLGASADGFAFVSLWKNEFPQIERAVIFTASDIKAARTSPNPPPEVDAIIAKADGLDAIVRALLVESR